MTANRIACKVLENVDRAYRHALHDFDGPADEAALIAVAAVRSQHTAAELAAGLDLLNRLRDAIHDTARVTGSDWTDELEDLAARIAIVRLAQASPGQNPLLN